MLLFLITNILKTNADKLLDFVFIKNILLLYIPYSLNFIIQELSEEIISNLKPGNNILTGKYDNNIR